MRAAVLNLDHLQHGRGIVNIKHDCQPAETGNHLVASSSSRLPARSRLLRRQSGNVAARLRQTCDQAAADGVERNCKDDGERQLSPSLMWRRCFQTATITSTLSWTNSAAISASRSGRARDQRYSIATVRPSIQPSSRSRSKKASVHGMGAAIRAQEADGRHLTRLLRVRREWPRDRRTTDKP